MGATLGLVAGRGLLPFEVARGARRAGRRVWLAGLRGLTDPALAALADAAEWLHVGEVGALLAGLRRAGATEVVLCGGVPKELLFAEPALVRLDARARALLEGARDRRDDALQRAVADALEAEGFPVVSQAAYVPELLAPEGPLGARSPTASERDDLAFAWPLAKAIGALDIGQTLVVRGGAVLAVEAIEGTDAAIRRGGRLGRGAVSVLKVWKPSQDPRLDFPVIGPATLATLIEAGGTLLAVEAGRTLVLEREEVVARGDAAGVCVLGVPAAGPGPEGAG
jgi:DUF1009 family protein